MSMCPFVRNYATVSSMSSVRGNSVIRLWVAIAVEILPTFQFHTGTDLLAPFLLFGSFYPIAPGGESGCDISQIPCRVCGGPSSGFHFGALTCEGCKVRLVYVYSSAVVRNNLSSFRVDFF